MRRRTARRYLSVLLSVIILLNVFMSSAWYLIYINGHEMSGYHSNTLKGDDELEMIKISAEESMSLSSGFLRLNDHEFLYQKKLYDVIRSVTAKGFTYYYCLNDSKEEKILAQIRQCISSHLDYFSAPHHGTLLFIKLFSQENACSGLSERTLEASSNYFAVEKREIYSFSFLKKIYSPPENFFS